MFFIRISCFQHFTVLESDAAKWWVFLCLDFLFSWMPFFNFFFKEMMDEYSNEFCNVNFLCGNYAYVGFWKIYLGSWYLFDAC